MNKKQFPPLLLTRPWHFVVSLFLVLSWFITPPSWAAWFSEQQDAMGTRISVTVWSDDEALARKAIAALMQEMQRIDNTYSPYIEQSDLVKLNRFAAIAPQPVTDEMQRLLAMALDISQLTDGAFDITFASVGHLYDYRKRQQPSPSERQKKQAAIDYHLIALNDNTVLFKHPDVVIDLGGIAKGYAADRAIAILRQYGIQHASFSAGGDSRLLGDRRGRPWIIGIKNPRQQDEIVIRLPLDNAAVSTSGDYERFFIDAKTKKRVHHIINPRSGTPAQGVASVTIIGDSGLRTDPLSTSVFVMGVDKGLALINRLPDLDAIIIDTQGKVSYSNGLLPSEN